MAQEDLLEEKHDVCKIPPNMRSAWNHELFVLRGSSKAGPALLSYCLTSGGRLIISELLIL
jgi:hypothetical protein